MVIRNGGSKNSTSPPYLVKNERSLIWIRALNDNDIQKLFITKFAVISPFVRVGKKLHLSVTCEVSHEWLDFYQAPKNVCAYKER